jgi:hypothetical protein
MKARLAVLVLLLLAVSPAFARTDVSIGVYIGGGPAYYPPPPPPVYMYRPPCPGPGYMWVPGYWYGAAPRYSWRAGYWARPGYYGAPLRYRGYPKHYWKHHGRPHGDGRGYYRR